MNSVAPGVMTTRTSAPRRRVLGEDCRFVRSDATGDAEDDPATGEFHFRR